MAIKLSQKPYQREVRWRYSSFENTVILVSETPVRCWVQPSVITIHSEQYLVVVLMVKLLKDFSDRVSSQHWVSLSNINYVHDLFGIRALIRHPISELFVPLVELFQLLIVEVALPVIRPALSQCVPSPWARVSILVLLSSQIVVSVNRHVDIHFSEDLLIGNF